MAQYKNLLSLRHGPKGIPYPAGVPREDGDQNHGFMNLKGGEVIVDDVPEMAADSALRALVAAINQQGTDLFSVGCVSDPVQAEQGFRYTGYVEFGVNSRAQIAYANTYFSIYFHFDRALDKSGFDLPFKFDWELQPAEFTQLDVRGFTCAVFLNVAFQSTPETAQEVWTQALGFLGDYLGTVKFPEDDQLY